MTISTISSGVGLKTLAGNKSLIDDKRGSPQRQSVGATAPPADGAEVRAILFNSTANPRTSNSSSETQVTPVVNGLGLGLRFSTDQVTGKPVITVIDVESGKVVRQIPSEEVLDFMRQLESAKGALLSVKL